jgi:hypothetical protein
MDNKDLRLLINGSHLNTWTIEVCGTLGGDTTNWTHLSQLLICMEKSKITCSNLFEFLLQVNKKNKNLSPPKVIIFFFVLSYNLMFYHTLYFLFFIFSLILFKPCFWHNDH